MNTAREITSMDDLVDLWPFLLEGLSVLNTTTTKRPLTQDRYGKILMRVVLGNQDRGTLMVLFSERGKPLAYMVLIDNTAWFDDPTVLCFALYSKYAGAVSELKEAGRRWCKERGYGRVYAVSKRLSRGAIKLFERKWGFEKDGLVFCQEV